MIKTAHDSDLGQIVSEVLSALGKSNVTSIYLFGSVARGDDTQGSDYDIAVIVKKYPRNDLRLISRIKSSLMDVVKKPIDIIFLEQADLEQADLEQSPHFLRELCNNNKRLFGTDTLMKYRTATGKRKPAGPIVKAGPVWYHA